MSEAQLNSGILELPGCDHLRPTFNNFILKLHKEAMSLPKDSKGSKVFVDDEKFVLDVEGGGYHTPLTGPPSNDKRGGIAYDEGAVANEAARLPKYVPVVLGPQHFELVCKIGQGAFGQVLLVKPRLQSTVMNSNKAYAMKVISKKLLRAKNNLTYMRSERDIMSKVIWSHMYMLYSSIMLTIYCWVVASKIE